MVPAEPPPEPEPPFAGVALETDEPPCGEPEEDEDVLLDGAGWLDSGPNSVATCWPEAGAAAVEDRWREVEVSRFAAAARFAEVVELTRSGLDVVCADGVYSAASAGAGRLSALARFAGGALWG